MPRATQEMRQLDAWLSARETAGIRATPLQREGTAVRRARNAKKARAVERRIRWQQRHRKTYNRRMREYRRSKRFERQRCSRSKRAGCGVYGFRMIGTDRWYVGQSISIAKRYLAHRSASKTQPTRFYAAVRQLGWDAFEFVLLELCPVELLMTRERFWIEQLGALGSSGFNGWDAYRPTRRRCKHQIPKPAR